MQRLKGPNADNAEGMVEFAGSGLRMVVKISFRIIVKPPLLFYFN